jgi:hypothetical protein
MWMKAAASSPVPNSPLKITLRDRVKINQAQVHVYIISGVDTYHLRMLSHHQTFAQIILLSPQTAIAVHYNSTIWKSQEVLVLSTPQRVQIVLIGMALVNV